MTTGHQKEDLNIQFIPYIHLPPVCLGQKLVNRFMSGHSVMGKVNMTDEFPGSETVASDCWPSAELQAERVICHVRSTLSAASTTVDDTHHHSSSFPLAEDETNFSKTRCCVPTCKLARCFLTERISTDCWLWNGTWWISRLSKKHQQPFWCHSGTQ